MFRDLKEYQEIAKIYVEKVSKPSEAKSDELVENQENRRKLTQQRTKQNQGRVEKQFGFLKPKPRNLKDGQTSVRQSGVNDPRRKKIETNKEPEYKPEPELKVKPTYQSNRDKMIQSRSANRLKSREEVGLGNNVKLSDKNKKIDTSFDTTKIIDKAKAKAKADKEIDSQVDKYVEKRKVPINKDLTIDKSAEGKAKYKILKKEIEPEVKKPEVSTMTKQGEPRTKAQMMAAKRIAAGKTISDVNAENEASMRAKAKERFEKFKADREAKRLETKPKKMHSIEKKNRARLGDARVDALKAKNADFKLMRKGQMSKDDFIKKYPKSITAQRSKGLRDHTEWDAYDMVLEYLFSTEQVATIEEANYVMTEMDSKTIQSIISD